MVQLTRLAKGKCICRARYLGNMCYECIGGYSLPKCNHCAIDRHTEEGTCKGKLYKHKSAPNKGFIPTIVMKNPNRHKHNNEYHRYFCL